ncbi:MAG: recombinase family protein [Eubacteriales bacterium]
MKKYMIALYIRLSLEDAKTDSMSISSQRSILREYASELPEYANAELMEFVDNGYSGANFERPAVQELLDLVRTNRIDCIMVKDFSRFGRNSLKPAIYRANFRCFIPALSLSMMI